jgi:hypothetical protein
MVVAQHDGSANATHGCQSGVDEVVEDEMMMLATRLCWTKQNAWRHIKVPGVAAARATMHRKQASMALVER